MAEEEFYLNADELEHIVSVNAHDMLLRHQRLQSIRHKELAWNERKAQRDVLISGQNFSNERLCVLCCQTFAWPFNRAVQCSACNFKVCRECLNNLSVLCSLCIEQKEIKYQTKVWELNCPFNSKQFGFLKFTTPDKSDDPSSWDWSRRATLEARVEQFLKCSLDTIELDSSVGTEASIDQWAKNFDNLIISDNFDDSLAELASVKESLRDLHQRGRLPQISPAEIPRTYGQLLIRAVLLKLLNDADEWPLDNKVNSSTQTDVLTLDAASTQMAMEHVEKHTVGFPRLDSLETDGDSALDTDLESVCSWGRRNWFFKEAELMTPEGSMRSQRSSRVPVSLQSFVKSFGTSRQSSNDISDSESSSDSSVQQGQAPHFDSPLENATCKTGDLVQFRCSIGGSPPIDVYWYNINNEIPNQGRFRIIDRSPNHWLEIFDAEPADSGEIVCLAVNEISVATSIALLKVQECDVAGEEPQFTVELDSVVAKHNQTVRLYCAVTGCPAPRVTFHHNNLPLSSSEHYKIDRSENGHWTLEIVNAVVRDSGQYSSVATNRFGRIISKAAVSVTADPRQPRASPRRNKPPKRLSIPKAENTN